MTMIDSHHHLIEEQDYVDKLLRTMDRCAIEKTALIGLGPLFKGIFVKGTPVEAIADNDAVERTVRAHPDRFFGLGYIRLGVDTEADVDNLAARGFKGLKFHVPTRRYDDESFFPVYHRAAELGLPCLFHTGIVTLPRPCPEARISSFNMEVIHLESVAQQCPSLIIIAAHLGVQSHLTALTLIRLFPSIHADLSGATPGWRANLTLDDWRRLLWFEQAPRKILFGTDVHVDEFDQTIETYRQIAEAVGWNADQCARVFHHNAAELYEL